MFKYRVETIRSGGEEKLNLVDQMNRLGTDGWRFLEWIDEWDYSEGPGPHTRSALFIKQIDSYGGL